MSWLNFAFYTIIFYAGFDFFLKLTSGKIHDWLAVFLINLISTIILFAALFIVKSKGENIYQVKEGGYLYAVLAGISIGIASMTFIKMFSAGANLSIGVPLVRIGIVLLASLLGIIVLKEPVTLRYVLGMLLALSGLYLLIIK